MEKYGNRLRFVEAEGMGKKDLVKSYGGYLVIYAIVAWYLTRPDVKKAFS